MEAKEEIRQRLDLVEIIQEYVALKPAGSHALKALCPFHQEKTPSFHVSRDKQIWRCFGCGVGGDVFSFVMQMEGVDFPEALRLLAKKAGVEIQRFDTTEANERHRFQRLHQFAAAYYHRLLLEGPSALEARAYAERRGLNKDILELFQIGYAPDNWSAFSDAARQRGLYDQELINSGLSLAKKSGGGVIDRFRNRLMIPLHDVHGNVIGFTGRELPVSIQTSPSGANDPQSPFPSPKYLNSPETSLFKKGDCLYGLHLAKQAIRRQDAVIIVEGNLDVIASHKAGVEHVVASSGTALTERQITLLKRFTSRLIFCFDADVAGFSAAQRGIHLAQRMNCDVSVILIPSGAGKDPDEVVGKGHDLWRQITARPVPIMEYYFEQTIKDKDLSRLEDKRAVGRSLLAEIANLSDLIEREHWLQKLASLLRMEVAVLRQAMPVSTTAKDGGKDARDKVTLADNGRPSPSRRERAGLYLLGIFLERPEWRSLISERLNGGDLFPTVLRDLYRAAHDLYTQSYSDTPPFFKLLQETVKEAEALQYLEEAAMIGERTLGSDETNDFSSQVTQAIDYLREAVFIERRRELSAALRDAELVGDREEAKKLLLEIQKVNKM